MTEVSFSNSSGLKVRPLRGTGALWLYFPHADRAAHGKTPPHQGLFSDRYLNATLPTRPDWRDLADEARPVLDEIAGLLESYTPSENEAQVEEELVRPVLRLLGHTFEVQPALATPEGTKRPDYVLYGDARSAAANKGRTLTDESLRGSAFAVADAKYWERPLDVSLKGGKRNAFSNKNPSYQISFYVQHSGTEWGILTKRDGRSGSRGHNGRDVRKGRRSCGVY